jgi:hypothetical protein
MKNILTLTILGVVFSLVLASCGSSKTGHCDAYSSTQQVQNTDVASK